VKYEEAYRIISEFLRYPEDRDQLLLNLETLKKISCESNLDIQEFSEFIENRPISEMEEEYVRIFDMFPLCAPYISHHLFGESYKKGEFMVRLKETYRMYNYELPSNELPDHIYIILDFMSVLDREDRIQFLYSGIFEGLKKMQETIKEKKTPYRLLFDLIYFLCLTEIGEMDENADSEKEVVNCSTL